MRKFLTILFAIILALLLALSVSSYRNQGDLSGVSLKGLTNWITGLFEDDKPRIPEQPDNPQTVTDYQEFVVDPNLSYEEHIAKGDHFFERGFWTFASNEYAAAIAMEPDSAEAYLRLMETNYALRDYKKAINNAESILSLQPNDFETKLLKARAHLKLTEFDQALALLDSMTLAEGTDPRVLYNQGLIKAALRQNDEARNLFQLANDTATDPELKEKISFFLDSFTEYSFTQAEDEDHLYSLTARAFNKAEEYELTIEILRETLQRRSDLRDAWILFGFAYLNLEQYQFSRTAFERAYQLDVQWSATQYFLGLNHKELGNKDEAIVFFNYALNNQFDPEVVIHRHLADLYFDTQDYTNAVKSYEKVLELSNEEVDAFVRPVWLYLDFLNQPDKALTLAQVAIGNFPENAMAHNLLGWSLTGLNRYQEAESSLLKALELDPDLPAAKYNLGNLYRTQNRNEEALQLYQEAYNLDQNGSIGTLAAQAYNQLSNEPQANEDEESES